VPEFARCDSEPTDGDHARTSSVASTPNARGRTLAFRACGSAASVATTHIAETLRESRVRLEPEQLIEAARRAGRQPAQRTTLYEIVESY
jgi:2-iminoacetate synthase ThiH